MRGITGLRLLTGITATQVADTALEAVVPGLADGAVVFGLESLLRGGAFSGAGDDPDEIPVRRIGIRSAGDVTVPDYSFPAGKVMILAAGSPYARCVRRAKPVRFTGSDAATLRDITPRGRQALSRYTSFLVVPMVSGDAVAGLVGLARGPGAPAFSDADIAEAAQVASYAGTGIVTAIMLRRHESISHALQQGLLAAEPPRPARVEMEERCLPAAGQLIGGDWYDLIPLPGDRTGLVIGDVMGHGPKAAALMAQLRAAAHALAQLDLEPAELLRQLDRTTATLPGVGLATCVYAVIDPIGRTCTLAAAGHLPPVLARPDGSTRALDLPSGQSLGLGLATYGQARIKLPPGAVLALYTDGLVETRTRSFDQGISTVRAELSAIGDPLAKICDRLIHALADHPEDDVTLILVRIPDSPPTPTPTPGLSRTDRPWLSRSRLLSR